MPEAKITRYLLSETHADGRGKARFFTAHGFSSAQWGIMAAALRDHAMTHVVVEEAQTPFGVRYVTRRPLPVARRPVAKRPGGVVRSNGQ